MLNWSKMSPDSSRHQVNTPDFQSVCPRLYVFLQHWMWWTRLRSACWCMLIYSVTEKPISSYGNRFPSLIPTELRGGRWTLPLASFFCPSAPPWNHNTISCQTGSEHARWSTPLLPRHRRSLALAPVTKGSMKRSLDVSVLPTQKWSSLSLLC